MSILGVTPKRPGLMDHALHRSVEWPLILHDVEAGDKLAAIEMRYNVPAYEILTALSCAGYPLSRAYGQNMYPWHQQFLADVAAGMTDEALEQKYPVHAYNYKKRHGLVISDYIRVPRPKPALKPEPPMVEPPRVMRIPTPPPPSAPVAQQAAAPVMNSVQTGMIPVYNQFGNIVGVMQTTSPFAPATPPIPAQPNVSPPVSPSATPPQSEDDIILRELDEAIRPVLNSLRIILRHSGPAARQTLLTILKQATARYTATITGVEKNSWTQSYFILGSYPDSLVIIGVHVLLPNMD